MTLEQIEALAISPGDRIYARAATGVVRSGIYLGLEGLPWSKSRRGVCLAYDGGRSMVDWYAPEHLDALELTIPAAVASAVAAEERGERA